MAGLPVRPTELEEAYLVNAVVDIYRHNKCVYGVRKMWHAARRAGLALGRDQVGRLMRMAGVQGVRRGAHGDHHPRRARTTAP